jgi:hypothetical protein
MVAVALGSTLTEVAVGWISSSGLVGVGRAASVVGVGSVTAVGVAAGGSPVESQAASSMLSIKIVVASARRRIISPFK